MNSIRNINELFEASYFYRVVNIDGIEPCSIKFDKNWRSPSGGRLDGFIEKTGVFGNSKRSYWVMSNRSMTDDNEIISIAMSEAVGTKEAADKCTSFIVYRFDGKPFSSDSRYQELFAGKLFLDLSHTRSSRLDMCNGYGIYTDKIVESVCFEELLYKSRDIIAIKYKSSFKRDYFNNSINIDCVAFLDDIDMKFAIKHAHESKLVRCNK